MQQATYTPRTINFKKERNFGEKLNATFAFISENARPIGKNLLLIAGPFALLTGIFYGMYQAYTFNMGMASPDISPWESSTGNLSFMVLSFVGMLITSILATTLVVAIVFRHIRHYVEEGNALISTATLWSTIWKDFFSVLGTTIFIMVAFIFTLSLLMVPFFLLAAGNPNPVVIGIVMIILFFGILFLFPITFLIYPIRSIERKDVFTATGRLFHLVSGKWLSTVGLVIVAFIIQSIISMVFAVPMYIMMFLRFMHAEEDGFATNSSGILYDIFLSAASGLSMLGSFMLYSILFVALTFQYFNLVERKEGRGLLERMESFGKQRPEPDDHEEQF